MKQIAMPSNMPHMPEMIIVKGENSHRESTQKEAEPGFLWYTYENIRYARATSPKITGCFKRK